MHKCEPEHEPEKQWHRFLDELPCMNASMPAKPAGSNYRVSFGFQEQVVAGKLLSGAGGLTLLKDQTTSYSSNVMSAM